MTHAQVAQELSTHPALDALSGRVRWAALRAASDGMASFGSAGSDAAEPGAPELSAEQAETPFGNLLNILEQGAQNATEQELLSALLAHGISSEFPSAPESEQELAGRLVWLATHTPVNALAAADVALGERAATLWQAVRRIVEEPQLVGLGRAESISAALALRLSRSEAAQRALGELRYKLSDPLLVAAIAAESSSVSQSSLAGELYPAPRGPVATALLALSGLMFIAWVVRLFGKLALGFKRPAQLCVSERGVEIRHRVELLGKVLRERETVMPLDGLKLVTREIKFAGVGLYAGLFALALGSYLGVGLFIDGTRVPGGSFPLIGFGILFIVLGLAIDFGLGQVANSTRGKCRLLLVPLKGRTLCVAGLERNAADRMLSEFAERTQR